MVVIILRCLVTAVAILLASILFPGITVDSLSSALIAAGLLGLINVFIKPVLIILTLPLNILTLGIFSFIINALLLKLVAWFVAGFEVAGFFSALFGALVISLANWFANRFIVTRGIGPSSPNIRENPDYIDLEQKGNGKWE
jgi:putative membrane protein